MSIYRVGQRVYSRYYGGWFFVLEHFDVDANGIQRYRLRPVDRFRDGFNNQPTTFYYLHGDRIRSQGDLVSEEELFVEKLCK